MSFQRRPSFERLENRRVLATLLANYLGEGLASTPAGEGNPAEPETLGAETSVVVSADELQVDMPGALDFGDAPAPYPVTLAANGARHANSALTLGPTVDVEFDGQPSATASGDGVDEDGVLFLTNLVTASSPTTASVSVQASAAGKLDGWIDFDGNGAWSAAEQIFISQDVAAGDNTLSFIVPAAASFSGETFARFRLSSLGGLQPTGPAEDGEVEDYQVEILNAAFQPVAVRMAAPHPGTVEVTQEANEIVAKLLGEELLRMPVAAIADLGILGTGGNDVLSVGDVQVLVGGDGGNGYDIVRLAGSNQVLDLPSLPDIALQNVEEIDIRGAGDNTLVLNLGEVRNASSTTDTLRVRHDATDSVDYGIGWVVQKPEIIDSRYVHVAEQAGARIEVENDRPYHNFILDVDVDGNNLVSAVDVSILVTEINTNGVRSFANPSNLSSEFYYFDPTNDNLISAQDVNAVITFINSQNLPGGGGAGGEGESKADVLPQKDLASSIASALWGLGVPDRLSNFGLPTPEITNFVEGRAELRVSEPAQDLEQAEVESRQGVPAIGSRGLKPLFRGQAPPRSETILSEVYHQAIDAALASGDLFPQVVRQP